MLRNYLNERLIILLLIVFFLPSCNSSKKKDHKPISELNLKYAKGFRILNYKDFDLIKIYNPNDASKVNTEFIIHNSGAKIPNRYKNLTKIKRPISKMVCLTLTQLSYISELGGINKICGMNSSRFLFNKKIKKRIQEGKIKLVGRKGNFKPEIIMKENPDVIFVSPFKEGGYASLKDVNMKLIPVFAYNENHPLARAEWLKFFAEFTGKRKLADSVFNKIDKKYNSLKNLTKNIKNRPTIFSGECKSGVWYAVGGKSYLSHYFHDAGADYIFKDNKESGALRIDFESIYAKAAKAKYWRILNSNKGRFSYNILESKDERYKDFYAFKNKNIIYCNMREKAFYETSPVKPHIILADYIKSIHPELLPQYNNHYYSILK